jgi:hypothetical protein
MIGMYQVKKVSSGVSRFKFCWSKVNPQTVTIFENKMPSIDRIEFSSQLVPLFVFVFVQQAQRGRGENGADGQRRKDLGGHIKTAVGQIQKQKVVPVVRKTQSDRSMAFYSQILLRSEG